MSGVIDHWSNNDCTYGHGIICQRCPARKYSEKKCEDLFVDIGTFVEVHSIRGDDVLFCIVDDDMQVDTSRWLCKKSDIIHVPENLWGPLFTVQRLDRLPLLEDRKIAESIGNISVGDKVQVLGPDKTSICIANVTFKNSIGRLGVGVFFGLQILSPKENIQAIIKKVSLLEPGTKGFPRGCDIVVSVDKIHPYKRENSLSYYDKENQKDLVGNLSSVEDIKNTNFKSMAVLSLKEKLSNTGKKCQQISLESSLNNPSIKKMANSENPLVIGEEVIYLEGDTPERGIVKWIGYKQNSLKVQVEFENPVGAATDSIDGSKLFKTQSRPVLLVPPMALIKLSDYMMNNTKENIQCKYNNNYNYNYNNNNNNNNNINYNNNNNNNNKKKNNNNNNNNNNYNTVKSNDFRHNDNKHNIEEKYKTSKIMSNSHQCLKHPERTFPYKDLFQIKANEEVNQSRRSCTSDFHKSDDAFELQLQHNSKSFDLTKPSEKKINCGKHFSSLDHDHDHDHNLLPDRESKIQNSCTSGQKTPSQDLYDLMEQTWARPERPLDYGSCNKCQKDSEITSASPKTFLCHSNTDAKAKARKCHRVGDSAETEIYDDLPREIRNVRFHCYSPKNTLDRDSRADGSKDPRQEDFYSARRHTKVHHGFWEPSHLGRSSSDENLIHYYDTPKPRPSSPHVPKELGKGSVVELTYEGEAHYGVIRWIGTLPDEKDEPSPRLIAGVEMEEEADGCADAAFSNRRCFPGKALFIPLSECRKDSRFQEDNHRQTSSSKINYGQIDCPIVEGTVAPINRKGDIESICGKNRGIQGHHNSCYLDATLFSMFAFTSVFDSLLYRPPTKHDVLQYSEVQRVLREEIVNPLRKNLYVRADRVMKLRTLLDKLSSVSGLTSEEKDPEEFLNSLLAQILKAEPFLKLSSGQEAFHYQLFVEKDERLIFPSVQQLFEQSFVTSDIKLKQVPSCLIIQMPRFGKSFKMYSKILPPQLLDITDIIENSPRQCTVCGRLAEFECKECFGQHGIGNGLESISFCKTCLETAHNHHCRTRHNYRSLTVPLDFLELQEHCNIPRLYLELFAVVCIETSHYVAFVKCGSGSDAPWCFFDSMADRKGEQNGYNIPEMVPCPDLPYWLSEDGARMINEMEDERQLPEHAKRLFSDAYMCMYQSPDLMMYR